jgi:hypothetical protein
MSYRQPYAIQVVERIDRIEKLVGSLVEPDGSLKPDGDSEETQAAILDHIGRLNSQMERWGRKLSNDSNNLEEHRSFALSLPFFVRLRANGPGFKPTDFLVRLNEGYERALEVLDYLESTNPGKFEITGTDYLQPAQATAAGAFVDSIWGETSHQQPASDFVKSIRAAFPDLLAKSQKSQTATKKRALGEKPPRRRRTKIKKKPPLVDDGPIEPNLIQYKGTTATLEPIPWRLLKFTWGKSSVAETDVIEAVWGDGSASAIEKEGPLKSAVRKANRALAEVFYPKHLGRKSGFVTLV